MLQKLRGLDRRWWSLLLLCLGDLMIVLDVTIVNVALPTIRTDLGFTETALVWVVNAYMLTFSGFLLLGGRLGDLYGHKKIFLGGLVLFTLASLLCGIAQAQWMLIVARAIQGLGGAVVSAVALSLIMNLFTEPADRAKAMGLFGFVAAGGGAIGVFLGGIITTTLSWHWVFLVNVPVGIAVYALCHYLLPSNRLENAHPHLDIAGAITVTLSLMLAVFGIVNGNAAGWASAQTLATLGAAAALFLIFLSVELRTSHPLVPLGIFRRGNIAVSSVIGILWSAAMFACFFISALYLQLVLQYTPLQVGLSFLPANLIMAAFSLGLSARVVMRYGKKYPLAVGMGLLAIGLLLFSFAPVNGSFLVHVLPGMTLLGIGAGLAFNPVLLAATEGVHQDQAGLVSGVLNTAFMMGGSLGLAILASLAAARTAALELAGEDMVAALTSGYHLAFFVGAVCAGIASFCAAVLLKENRAAGRNHHVAMH